MATSDEQPTGDAIVVNQEGEEYKTQGRTRLATRHGVRFQPSDKSLPVITSAGVFVTAVQAEAIKAESRSAGGTVYQVETDQNQEG